MTTTLLPSFDPLAYITQNYDPDLLRASRDYRRLATRLDPLLFALLYRDRALRLRRVEDPTDTRGMLSLADFHRALIDMGIEWIGYKPLPKGYRRAIIAPRNMGKSTWLYNILLLWAAAHGHTRVVATFAHNAKMASKWFSNFRTQIESNRQLQFDFPEMCTPAKRRSGGSVSDNQELYVAESGFAIGAFGVDNVAVGLNINDERPDLILLDDVEPDEGNYSAYLAAQRLATIRTAILPMEDSAKVILVGTTLMYGSLIHQLVRAATGGEVASWITEERFKPLYFPPIITNPDGTERSCWPEKWSLDYLNSIRETRDYKMTFENNPVSGDSAYWQAQHFSSYSTLQTATRWIISVDPHVSKTEKSDWTGIAVVAYSPVENKTCVHHIEQVKLTNDALRAHVIRLSQRFPSVQRIVIETNQGGVTWESVFHTLPPNLALVPRHVSAKKEVRAANALSYYDKKMVMHAEKFPVAEQQMLAFPNVMNDDMVDAVVNGVLYFFESQAPVIASVEVE